MHKVSKNNFLYKANDQEFLDFFSRWLCISSIGKSCRYKKMNKETAILLVAVALAIGGLSTLYEAPSDNLRA
jgi:hypothetical protein